MLAAAVGSPDPHAGEIPVAYVELKEEATITDRNPGLSKKRGRRTGGRAQTGLYHPPNPSHPGGKNFQAGPALGKYQKGLSAGVVRHQRAL